MLLRYEEGAIRRMDRAPASLSSLPRRPGPRTSASPSWTTSAASRHPPVVVDRATSLERGIGQQRPADDELVIKLSDVGAAAHRAESRKTASGAIPSAEPRSFARLETESPTACRPRAVRRRVRERVTRVISRRGPVRVADWSGCVRAPTDCQPVPRDECRSEARLADRGRPTASSPRADRPRNSPSSGHACGRARSSRKVRSCSRITPPIGNSSPVLYPQFAHSKTSELRRTFPSVGRPGTDRSGRAPGMFGPNNP